MSYVEVGQREGRLVVGGEPDGGEGWYNPADGLC